MNYSGAKKGPAQAPVAIARNKTMAVRLIIWGPVNEKILWGLFRLGSTDLKVVVVYGLVEGSCTEGT